MLRAGDDGPVVDRAGAGSGRVDSAGRIDRFYLVVVGEERAEILLPGRAELPPRRICPVEREGGRVIILCGFGGCGRGALRSRPFLLVQPHIIEAPVIVDAVMV
jgi:hypothetical protein